MMLTHDGEDLIVELPAAQLQPMLNWCCQTWPDKWDTMQHWQVDLILERVDTEGKEDQLQRIDVLVKLRIPSTEGEWIQSHVEVMREAVFHGLG